MTDTPGEIAFWIDGRSAADVKETSMLYNVKIYAKQNGDPHLVPVYLAAPAQAAIDAREQVAAPMKPRMWHDRIKDAHPRSEPEYWPSSLKAEYMEAEILELRAALASRDAAPAPAAAGGVTDAMDEGSVRKALSNALRECDTTNAQRLAIFDAFMPRWRALAQPAPVQPGMNLDEAFSVARSALCRSTTIPGVRAVLDVLRERVDIAMGVPVKPFPAPGAWFPVDVLGNPMREHQPGKWEVASWPSAPVQQEAAAIADAVVRMVGEMDDRTSPEDWPEAMLVTGPELHAFILLAFERAALTPPAVAAPAVPDGDYPELPHCGCLCSDGPDGSRSMYSEEQMWAYVDADRKARPALTLRVAAPTDLRGVFHARDPLKILGKDTLESALRRAISDGSAWPGITDREAKLIARIRAECDHAGINDMRLPPRFGQQQGVIAVPEDNIDATIEGWQREHGLPIDTAAPAQAGETGGA